jgi:hypothetical protein
VTYVWLFPVLQQSQTVMKRAAEGVVGGAAPKKPRPATGGDPPKAKKPPKKKKPTAAAGGDPPKPAAAKKRKPKSEKPARAPAPKKPRKMIKMHKFLLAYAYPKLMYKTTGPYTRQQAELLGREVDNSLVKLVAWQKAGCVTPRPLMHMYVEELLKVLERRKWVVVDAQVPVSVKHACFSTGIDVLLEDRSDPSLPLERQLIVGEIKTGREGVWHKAEGGMKRTMKHVPNSPKNQALCQAIVGALALRHDHRCTGKRDWAS